MTEYWVSQGNKWCDYCKIYIANNPVSIRTHEFGQRHKDNVANKLATIRKENATKEKETKQAMKDLERIEAQAKRSYEKDLTASKKALHLSPACADLRLSVISDKQLPIVTGGSTESLKAATTAVEQSIATGSKAEEWTYDDSSGYFYNAATCYYYDQKSGLYYSESLGKWTTQEDASKAYKGAGLEASNRTEDSCSGKATSNSNSLANAQLLPSNFGVEPTQFQSKTSRGVPSSIAVGKRKREGKAAPISKEEAAALAAREAARKRMQEREKSLMGLY
ncbi:hypothetical protein O6H91_04G067800 [Diphasiastrum complanatum]|uniref:Uncharacterized protein n=1 Tax=Diphasiastrum complanatum TaxID=34168 RepID=A0ACC2DXZ2_DIPCM|nr:hypothetical protein O6H91_04G067800 [Diphasiastrum complanatum]